MIYLPNIETPCQVYQYLLLVVESTYSQTRLIGGQWLISELVAELVRRPSHSEVFWRVTILARKLVPVRRSATDYTA